MGRSDDHLFTSSFCRFINPLEVTGMLGWWFYDQITTDNPPWWSYGSETLFAAVSQVSSILMSYTVLPYCHCMHVSMSGLVCTCHLSVLIWALMLLQTDKKALEIETSIEIYYFGRPYFSILILPC